MVSLCEKLFRSGSLPNYFKLGLMSEGTVFGYQRAIVGKGGRGDNAIVNVNFFGEMVTGIEDGFIKRDYVDIALLQ